jgi:pyrroloquinoline quinone biosynthesis protein B
VAQDAGHPQIGCTRTCCAAARTDASLRHRPASLAIVDPATGARWLVDATPEIRDQLAALDAIAPPGARALDGVLLTHAHLGHYTGLAQFGREAMGARDVPVWAMPRMRTFLAEQAPWEMLVRLGNIRIEPLENGRAVRLGERIEVTPIAVKHRDEYTETVGFRIRGPGRAVLWLPDIDTGEGFALERELDAVDVAYVDGTFWADGELVGRDMREVPHPRISATIEWFRNDPRRSKVRFVHMNHTNPALDPVSAQSRSLREAGFAVAVEGERVDLGG